MMNKMLWILIILNNILNLHCLQENSHTALCRSGYTCMPVNQCHENSSIVYPCDLNLNHVCCPQDVETRKIIDSTEVFPEDCGTFQLSDRIHHGRMAELGEFPWMALLGYTQPTLDAVAFSCGGTIITNQYILTAAHCIEIHPNLKLTVVRLGEQDLMSSPDCNDEKTICALPHVDVEVDKSICHAKYSNVTYENDIALVKLKDRVNFTSYVVPICLPFQKFISKAITEINGTKMISGWGKTYTSQVGESSVLMIANVILWDSNNCSMSLPDRVKPLKDSQLCASGKNNEDSCKGDSGGPMTDTAVVDADVRKFQIGIVSFGTTLGCEDITSPTVYTKVEYYLDWIRNNVN